MKQIIENKGLILEGDERLDRLKEGRWIIHRTQGHRATTDDQLLAWAVVDFLALSSKTGEDPSQGSFSILELGMGKGTVTLWLSSLLHYAYFFGIEAYQESYLLSLKNRQLNDLDTRFFPLLGDLRSPQMWKALDRLRIEQAAGQSKDGFDIIVGAPPFMPVGSGILPKDVQRACGRFELKGGVEDYLKATKACLSISGFAVILMDGANEARAMKAGEREGLSLVRCVRIIPRPDRAPTYTILCFTRDQATKSFLPKKIEEIAMRNSKGDEWSKAYQMMRCKLGI